MKILIVADYYPMPDRASGDLRFFTIIKMLAGHARLYYCAYDASSQRQEVGGAEADRYLEQLSDIGVTVVDSSIERAIKEELFDVVFFEFYFAARTNIENVRFYQPQAIVVVDSVDVHFKRLMAKAELSGTHDDRVEASRVREDELNTYSHADFVIVVTKDDQSILEDNIRDVKCVLLPNIHDVPPCSNRDHVDEATLLFVGGFRHEPNVDAINYLYAEIFPRVLTAVPHAMLNIVGGDPPEGIKAMAGENIRVLGYVPDIVEYYRSATVSVAPLRFGGGMKGKVGEAMSYTVPVVTTAFGAEGFGVEAGKHLIVADDPDEFADQVIQLIKDKGFNMRIAQAGWQFIYEHYSYDVLSRKVVASFQEMVDASPRRLSFLESVKFRVSRLYRTHLQWRFG